MRKIEISIPSLSYLSSWKQGNLVYYAAANVKSALTHAKSTLRGKHPKSALIQICSSVTGAKHNCLTPHSIETNSNPTLTFQLFTDGQIKDLFRVEGSWWN